MYLSTLTEYMTKVYKKISVPNRLLKMSEPDVDSQSIRPMSVGKCQFVIYPCIFHALLVYCLAIPDFSCNCSKRYGE